MQEINWFNEIFYSTEAWGLLGPAMLVTITYLAMKKDRGLGVIWYMVSILITVNFYFEMSLTEAYFIWHIIIIILGGFIAILVAQD